MKLNIITEVMIANAVKRDILETCHPLTENNQPNLIELVIESAVFRTIELIREKYKGDI